jgi:hypothetical protein
MHQYSVQLFVDNVDSKERATLKDILFGDVWICSGQSNMQVREHRK